MLANKARDVINRVLQPAGVALVRRSTLQTLDRAFGASFQVGTSLPAGAAEYLTVDNPQLLDLQRRYAGHPATASTAWSTERVRDRINVQQFRGDTEFVYQHRGGTHPAQYAWAAEYVTQHDRLHLLDHLAEDGSFGAYTYDVAGKTISRDLLDSIIELNALDEHFGLNDETSILDIGAGYGRLAHRFSTVFPKARYDATDAIAMSTFISDYYLTQHLHLDNARALPLDQVAALTNDTHYDIAVSVHSFPECPLESVRWWIDLLASTDVTHLFIAADETELLTSELDGSRVAFGPLLERKGFVLRTRLAKYADSASAQEFGLYPDYHYSSTAGSPPLTPAQHQPPGSTAVAMSLPQLDFGLFDMTRGEARRDTTFSLV